MDDKIYTREDLIAYRKEWISALLEACGCKTLDQVIALAKIGGYTNKGKTILALSNDNNGSNDKQMYLSSLSKEAKKFVLDHNPNVYHSIMAVLNNHYVNDVEKLYKQYINMKCNKDRPYLSEQPEIVKEIMALCLKNFNRKRNK